MNVSVLVATYGDPLWIERSKRAVDSARAQTKHVAHLHAHLGMTLAETRNALGRTATGDWLCFLDADDELEPGYLDAMGDALRTHRIVHAPVTEARSFFDAPEALLVPLLRRVHNGNLATWASYPNKGRWPKVNECVIGTVVSRKMFEAVGGFRDTTDDGTPITMYEDWDLWLRCFDAGAGLVYTDAIYREHVSPAGRNTDAHSAQTMYDAIWRDHEARGARKQLAWMEEMERTEREVFPDSRPRGEVVVAVETQACPECGHPDQAVCSCDWIERNQ